MRARDRYRAELPGLASNRLARHEARGSTKVGAITIATQHHYDIYHTSTYVYRCRADAHFDRLARHIDENHYKPTALRKGPVNSL